jgi:hypothetical protein
MKCPWKKVGRITFTNLSTSPLSGMAQSRCPDWELQATVRMMSQLARAIVL